MIDYKQLFHTVKIQNQTLFFDLSNIQSLTALEVTELFSYAILTNNYKSIQTKTEDPMQQYLQQIGFFSALSKIKHINAQQQEYLTSNQEQKLLQLQTYTYKPEFYGSYETILTTLKNFGLADEINTLVGSSLGEIIDNAFSHNIGQWSNDIGPLVIGLMQNNTNKRELTVSICDFGIGILQTLRHNYPKINTETEAINLALKANTTGRPNQKGGNGLLFLQKNIFNGFKGTLFIRSTNTLVKIKKLNSSETITETLPFTLGVNIYFSVKY